MGAGKTVPAAKHPRKNLRDFELQEAVGELHDAIRRWHAVTVAATLISSHARLTAGGLETVRMLMIKAGSLATDAFDMSQDLQIALTTRPGGAPADELANR